MGKPLASPERVLELLETLDVHALVASTWENIAYLTGYWGFSQRLLRGVISMAILYRDAPDRPALVLPMSDLDMVAQASLEDVELSPYGAFFVEPASTGPSAAMERFQRLNALEPSTSPWDALRRCLRRLGPGSRIAIESEGLGPDPWHLLKSIENIEWVESSVQIRRLRMRKTPEEIHRLKQATLLAERAILRCLKEAQAGMTEKDMARIYQQEVLAGEGELTFAVVAFGERAAFPNAVPSDVPLEHGHVIRFDVGCRYLGYHADISRTASFGEPSKKVAQYCRAIEVGLDEAVAAMAPGVEASKVFQTAVEATRKSGIPHYRRHHVGHGIGLDIYEIPMLSPGSKTVLEEGMVFEVETPYYEIGLGGLQVEDTVVVLPEGAQRLNQVPARLMVVEV